MKHIDDTNFEAEVLKAPGTVLVDVSTTWCGPCKMLAPVLDSLEPLYEGKVSFCKLDADESPETARKYRIEAVPTVMLFRNGEVVDSFTGLRMKADIERFLNN